MSMFKEKAKKLLADMRTSRNRGTCTFVAEKTEEEKEFISQVKMVLGMQQPEGQPGTSSSTFEDLNNNEAPSHPDISPAEKFRQLALEARQRQKESEEQAVEMSSKNRLQLVNAMTQLMTVSELESVIRTCNQRILHAVKYRRQTAYETLRSYFKGSQSPKYIQQPETKINGFKTISQKYEYEEDLELAVIEFKRKWNSSYKNDEEPQKSLNDFLILKTLGKGAFGRVLLVQYRNTGQFYAMKVLEKEAIIVRDNIEGILNEKRTLQSVHHPFIVQLRMHFQDSVNLYMVMEFVGGGDLFFHLKRRHRFSEKEAQFYASQVLLALEYLHSLDIVYRDLKPENVLIRDRDGYIKLADFGACKRLKKSTTTTMFGTAEYLAPEIFLQKPYGKSVDFWAQGILLYEMVHGESPFHSNSDTETFEKILGGKMKFSGQLSGQLKHLITHLLKDNPTERYSSFDDVKEHPWFSSVNWKAVFNKQVVAPFVPKLAHRGDSRYFDKFSEEQKFPDSSNDSENYADTYKDVFKDF